MCNPITERTPVLHPWTEKRISSFDEDDINLGNNLCRAVLSVTELSVKHFLDMMDIDKKRDREEHELYSNYI